ncbi:hypothetical protein [Chitiniphilus eburneus]|uniref:Uncharacterized protein n=1 Tax=Chitiniphilus eburneus TaxID=2571148 RepID=A0A4U0PY05_9NEIS|nr:hypothetical protein [Chitiniphilus eburneus]TJZ73486.1 hypothetical protein FAZ21_09835 [Chitiniphilus eburneus]
MFQTDPVFRALLACVPFVLLAGCQREPDAAERPIQPELPASAPATAGAASQAPQLAEIAAALRAVCPALDGESVKPGTLVMRPATTDASVPASQAPETELHGQYGWFRWAEYSFTYGDESCTAYAGGGARPGILITPARCEKICERRWREAPALQFIEPRDSAYQKRLSQWKDGQSGQ